MQKSLTKKVEARTDVTFMKGTFRTLIRLKDTNGYISMNLIASGDVLVFSVTIVIRNMVCRLVENVEISQGNIRVLYVYFYGCFITK